MSGCLQNVRSASAAKHRAKELRYVKWSHCRSMLLLLLLLPLAMIAMLRAGGRQCGAARPLFQRFHGRLRSAVNEPKHRLRR